MTTENINSTLEETINQVRLTPLHWRIWILSSMGIFIEGFNLFSISIAMPLIAYQFKPDPIIEGLIAGSAIIGTVIGAGVMGRLADIWGRKKFYILNALLVTAFSILTSLSSKIIALIIFQFFLGIGIGADYPLCASYITEFMPSRLRGKMLIGAFSFQALGMLFAAISGTIILNLYPKINTWHIILGIGSIPAFLLFIFRNTVPESPRWCIANGYKKKAIKTIAKLSRKTKREIARMVKREAKKIKKVSKKALPFSSLFKRKYLKRTALATIPWFLMDIATYGVGIFTPTIIGYIIVTKRNNHIEKILASIKGVAIIDIFLILGLIINIFLVEKLGRIKLQIFGFIGMAAGLFVLAASAVTDKDKFLYLFLLFGGFMLYSLLMNMGPNATTFILPAELFPTKLRATAHGFSAALAKMGAVIGILFLPYTIDRFGIFYTMIGMGIIALLGSLITLLFRVETMGKSLEELSHFEAGQTMSFYQIKPKYIKTGKKEK